MRRTLVSLCTVSSLLVSTAAQASPFALVAPAEGDAGASTSAPTMGEPAAPSLPPDGSGASPEASPQTPTGTEPPAEGGDPAAGAAEPPDGDAPAEDPAAAGEGGSEDPTAEGPEAAEDGEGLAEDPTATEDELTLSDEREAVAPGSYNRHGIGVRSGLTLVPTWILSSYLASHTNSLCRGDNINNFGADRGLTRQEGCNFYVGAEYIFRKSRVFDIVASAGYQSVKVPDGLWLDADEWDDSCVSHDGDQCDLGAADYTEIDLGFVFIEADFIGRAEVVRTPDVALQIGGGGGIGLGIIVGDGVFQTPLGVDAFGNPGSPDGQTCNRLEDLGDFTKCTPIYYDDPDIDQDGDGSTTDPGMPPGGDLQNDPVGNNYFADCSRDGCRESDLDKFGSRRENEDVPPVVPVVNLLLSMRLIVKDAFGINLQGGFNTGFYFGGSLQYFFGGGGKG